MKYVFLLLLSAIMFSCIEENEGRQTKEEVEVTRDFIGSQKWYARDIFYVGKFNNYHGLTREIEGGDCIFDFYYMFSEDDDRLDVTKKDKACEVKMKDVSTYDLNIEGKTLDLGIVFGFEGGRTLENIRFFNSLIKDEGEGDSITGEFDSEIDGKKIRVIYHLTNQKFVPYYK